MEAETGLLVHTERRLGGTHRRQCRAVNFVVIDEIHVLQHAQDGWTEQKDGSERLSVSKCTPLPLGVAHSQLGTS